MYTEDLDMESENSFIVLNSRAVWILQFKGLIFSRPICPIQIMQQ